MYDVFLYPFSLYIVYEYMRVLFQFGCVKITCMVFSYPVSLYIVYGYMRVLFWFECVYRMDIHIYSVQFMMSFKKKREKKKWIFFSPPPLHGALVYFVHFTLEERSDEQANRCFCDNTVRTWQRNNNSYNDVCENFVLFITNTTFFDSYHH